MKFKPSLFDGDPNFDLSERLADFKFKFSKAGKPYKPVAYKLPYLAKEKLYNTPSEGSYHYMSSFYHDDYGG